MSKMFKLQKYYYLLLIQSNKMIAPLILWIVFLFFAYSVIPVYMVTSTAVTSIALFFFMTWIGFLYLDMESPVADQLISIRIKSHILYRLSKIFFLFLIGIFMSFIGILIPQIQNVINDFGLYALEITFVDVLLSFIIHVALACVGVITSGFFQSRIIKDKKFASALILLVTIGSIVKTELVKQVAFLKFIFILFPPVDNVAIVFGNKTVFHSMDVVYILFICFFYSICGIILQIGVLRKLKFG